MPLDAMVVGIHSQHGAYAREECRVVPLPYKVSESDLAVRYLCGGSRAGRTPPASRTSDGC